MNIRSFKRRLLQKFRNLRYRRPFSEANVGARIATQLKGLRKRDGLSQETFAQELGMAQARISVSEKPGYQSYNIKTLVRIASHFDVALIVEFVSFKELINRLGTRSVEGVAPLSFASEIAAEELAAQHGEPANLQQLSLQFNPISRALSAIQPPSPSDDARKLITAQADGTCKGSVIQLDEYRLTMKAHSPNKTLDEHLNNSANPMSASA